MSFVDRERELASLQGFWESGRAECIPVVGRRRVGKTHLLEHFARDKRVVYFRCHLQGTAQQLLALGTALAELADDPVLTAQPPSQWPGVLALIERLAGKGRLLLVLDEIPYWVARDESVPSVIQNWWDRKGRSLDLVLVLCGSAVQMMENLLTGAAPLAGCVTGRLAVRPLDFRSAAQMLAFPDPVDSLTAYGILGGVPLYLGFFRAEWSIRANVLRTIASPTARLYVEPQTVFAAHHKAFDASQALAVLRAIAGRKHRWSEIAEAAGLQSARLAVIMDALTGDLGLVERVLPVTETKQTRAYYTQYHLTDNFFRFWFAFIEPNQGQIEFGAGEHVVDSIMAHLSEHMGPAFEGLCRDWTRLASAAGALPVRAVRVGKWWNPEHEIDVVALDELNRAAVVGEAKWQNQPFDWDDLEKYLTHTQALGNVLQPDALHLLFAKSAFAPRVVEWAAKNHARLLTPAAMLEPLERPVGLT